jgi:hypothetical protein
MPTSWCLTPLLKLELMLTALRMLTRVNFCGLEKIIPKGEKTMLWAK